MLDIHAISYYNIGPFAGKKLSVFFVGGKYLIKAPIGSGKSFLFFDGPLYGLYRASERRMLNIHHTQGYIKIIFSIHGEYYLITRQLTQGKSKESCTSQQFHIQTTDRLLSLLQTKDIIQHDTDIQDMLKKNGIVTEEITYKNESDLQQTLSTLLPPKEVFTSTMFLLQESKNIFELQPAERIEILKNVFDLLSIDEAKDRIAEKKREVQLQRKILGDTQHSDAKLRVSLTSLIQSYKILSQDPQRSSLQQYADTIREWEHIVDKITLEQCSIPDSLHSIIDTIHGQLKTYQAQQQTYQQAVTHIQQNISKLQQHIQTIGGDITKGKQDLQTISQQIAQANIPDAGQLKHELSQIIQKQEQAQSSIQTSQYDTIVQDLGLEISKNNYTLSYAHDVITACIQTGKLLAQESKNHTDSMKHLDDRFIELNKQLSALEFKEGTESSQQLQQEIQRHIERITQEKTVLLTKKQHFTQQAQDIQHNIDALQNRIQQISTDNPDIVAFVQEIQQALDINDTTKIQAIQSIVTKYLGDKQVAQLTDEINTLIAKQKNIKDNNEYISIDTQIAALEEKEKAIQSRPETVLHEFFATLEAKRQQVQTNIAALEYEKNNTIHKNALASIEQKLQTLKDFLAQINWKGVEELYTQRQTLETQKQGMEKQLQAIDVLVQQQQELQKRLDTLQIQIQQREQDKQSREQELQNEQNNLTEYIKNNILLEPSLITQREHQYKTIEKSYHTISELVRDHASNQQKLNILIQEEKLLTNLHQIVSKELLLLVLGESLTILTDIINVYLSQVFSLQLHLEIQKTSGDKVELAAYCEDEKGKREVKSLSGGQKTILKLVWMLAIASFLRAPLLFLDETINNIDKDTVGKVADMLTDFVKKQDMKLYTITHSEQIQTMNIWDGVIEVGASK